MIDFIQDNDMYARARLHTRANALKHFVSRPPSERNRILTFFGQPISNFSQDSVFCVNIPTVDFNGADVTSFSRAL